LIPFDKQATCLFHSKQGTTVKHTHAKHIVASVISCLAISAACTASASTLQTFKPLIVTVTDNQANYGVALELASANSTFALDTVVGPLGKIEGATGALNDAGVFLFGQRRTIGLGAEPTRFVQVFDQVSLNPVSLGFEQASGQLTHFSWAPQDKLEWFGTADDGVAPFLDMTNLSVDVANKQVLGNMVGGRYPDGVSEPISSFGFDNGTLFTFDTVTGVERLPTDQQWLNGSEATLNASGYTVAYKSFGTTWWREITGSVMYSGLRLTSQGLDVVRNTFNLSDENMASVEAANGSAKGLGSLTNTFTVSAAFAPAAVVPEPGTYGLMGLGLIGIILARQRARKAAISV
jgi:PEP-CTERM motif